MTRRRALRLLLQPDDVAQAERAARALVRRARAALDALRARGDMSQEAVDTAAPLVLDAARAVAALRAARRAHAGSGPKKRLPWACPWCGSLLGRVADVLDDGGAYACRCRACRQLVDPNAVWSVAVVPKLDGADAN
jgi:hypothetical protein